MHDTNTIRISSDAAITSTQERLNMVGYHGHDDGYNLCEITKGIRNYRGKYEGI